ncbi:cold-shock protein [Micromonospora mangrovi]|uniref:Cold shock domain-containing protein n=2 Tax=Micromonospora TaxID=1873 RepID=A0AAU7MFC8_9ACTN
MASGKIIRYNETKGYGFIAPDDGGEDLFIHVNDVGFPLTDRCVGQRVSYEVMEGQKGLKAARIQLLDPPAAPRRAAPTTRLDDEDDEDCEVLSAEEYSSEITEALMETAPSLTGAQIMKIRERLIAAGYARGWVVKG